MGIEVTGLGIQDALGSASGGAFGSDAVVGVAEAARRHLAIVDRSRLRRDCLRLALCQQPRRWRVTDVPAAADLVRLVRRGERFAVILLGASTCGQIDLVDIAQLAAAVPDVPILVAADCDDPERARLILRSGARGFLPTNLSLKILVAALERVRTGGSYVPLSLTEPPAEPEPTVRLPRHELTRRQRDVLALISEGKSNKLIADALAMSESTVKAHVKQIIKRLQVANRTQAALLATRPHVQVGGVAMRRVAAGLL
ncbi:MAG TPA: response regulator transcription factor [Stellaceae bacterium]|nr:response regulator transcription factor [Stellaceae bacterium]